MLHGTCRPKYIPPVTDTEIGKEHFHVPIISTLLQLGVNPNQQVITSDDEARTPWKVVLEHTYQLKIVNTRGA
jgi:hypothetical protein